MVINELSELPRVAQWIHAWARQNRLPAETVDRLDLCSTELVTNIISHGYDDGATHRIALTLGRQGDVLLLEIEDDGKPFNPLQAEPPRPAMSIENAHVGGFGLLIVRRFSDGLRYQRADGRNRFTVIHRCPAD